MPTDIKLDHRQLWQLHEALLAAFTSRNEFAQMLFYRTGARLDDLAPDVAPLPGAIFNVIQAAEEKGWTEMLVEGAHKHNPAHPLLRRFVADLFPSALVALAGADSIDEDPIDAYRLGSGRLFINRRQLRDRMQELTRPGPGIPPRILTVYSDLRRCGKSYSYEFIRFFAQARQERVAWVDLLEEVSLGSGLQGVVEEVGRQLDANLSTMPQQEAQTARWIRNLVFWLLGEVKRHGKFWWLVFDSIDHASENPGLPQEIHDFIARLAQQLEAEFDPPCRLVLIDFNHLKREDLPERIRQHIVEEVIRQEIVPSQLQDFIRAHLWQLLGKDGDEAHVHEVAAMLGESVTDKLNSMPEHKRPYALSSILQEALAGLEASLVVREDNE
jgi:hypothetical protein